MRRAKAAAGSAVFFLLAPGVVVGLIPWLLTGGWQAREPAPYWVYMQVLGGLLLVAGLFALVWAFVRFVVEGFGTPATGRRTRASGRRRSVSLRAQPDVRSGTGVYRRPGVALGPTRTAAVRWRRLAGRRGVRPLLRGTYPHPAFRRGLRDLPARGARLVASPSSLETQRAQRTRVEVMRSQATLGGSRSLIESGVSSCKIDSVATPCALVLRSRDCLRCSKIFSTALVETLRTRSRTSL